LRQESALRGEAFLVVTFGGGMALTKDRPADEPVALSMK
jgi:hypothetical protein